MKAGYFTLACFCDNLYQSLVSKLRSSEWQITRELRRHKVMFSNSSKPKYEFF
jgi:hypothetical protein